jgi:hypothetical protein
MFLNVESVATCVRVALDYCVPYVVSNLGVISGTRTARE